MVLKRLAAPPSYAAPTSSDLSFSAWHMFTDFLFPSEKTDGSNRPLTHPAEQSAHPSKMDDEFSRLAQRPPTHTEKQLLALLGEHLDPAKRDRSSEDLSIWVDGLLAESVVHLAVASGVCGARALLVSPLRDQLVQRQLRLSRRAPFFALPEGVKSAAARQAVTAWATPDELDVALVSRVFGAEGPDVIFVEDAHAVSPQSSAYRPSFDKLRAILQRYPKSLLVCTSSSSESLLRSDAARRLARPHLSATTPLHESALLSDTRVQFRVLAQEALTQGGSGGFNATLAQMMDEMPRPALLLCATVAQADEVYAALLEAQLPVHRFHSAMPESERAQHLVQFALPGRRAVMVATSGFFAGSGFAGEPTGDVPESFGPGYARRDIRSLVHLAAPASLEQFTQELRLLDAGPRPQGRAEGQGETEEPSSETNEEGEAAAALRSSDVPHAVSLLIYHPSQLVLSQALLERKRPGPETLMTLAEELSRRGASWVSEQELTDHGMQSRKLLQTAARFLFDAGLIEQQGDQWRSRVDAQQLLSGAETIAEDLDTLREGDPGRLRAVAQYSETTECRRRVLEGLLGRTGTSSLCGLCDVCLEERVAQSRVETARQSSEVLLPSSEEPQMAGRRRPPARRKRSNEDKAIALVAKELDSSVAPSSNNKTRRHSVSR